MNISIIPYSIWAYNLKIKSMQIQILIQSKCAFWVILNVVYCCFRNMSCLLEIESGRNRANFPGEVRVEFLDFIADSSNIFFMDRVGPRSGNFALCKPLMRCSLSFIFAKCTSIHCLGRVINTSFITNVFQTAIYSLPLLLMVCLLLGVSIYYAVI